MFMVTEEAEEGRMDKWKGRGEGRKIIMEGDAEKVETGIWCNKM